MKRSPFWQIPIAAVGSVFLVAVTVDLYLQLSSSGRPSSAATVLLGGACAIGLLVTICTYLATPKQESSLVVSGLRGAAIAFVCAAFGVALIVRWLGS